MRRVIAAAATALAALAAPACAGHAGSRDGFVARGGEEMRVYVENHNWLQVVVRAVSGSAQHRLGTVETAGQQTFVVPGTVAPTGIRFLVDPIGSSDTYLSPEVVPQGGLVVNLRIENHLALSTLTWR